MATVYAKPGRAMVAVASWAEFDGFQPARRFSPTERIPVPRGRGWLLVVSDGQNLPR